MLEISGLHDDRLLQDIALTLRRGEVLGIAGLAGAGKSELCKALFGATRSRVASGRLHGAPRRPRSPHDAVARGVALVPEERRREDLY